MSTRPLILNHVEMIYRPGERPLAEAYFNLLGFTITDLGPWIRIDIDPETANGVDNVMYASEPIPAQQAFEDVLREAIAAHPETVAALAHYNEVRTAHPHYNFHFGISVPTLDEWYERTAKAEEAARSDPLLKGRIAVSAFEPNSEGSVGPQYQTFVLTDILSTGTLQTGLIFEVQWTPTKPNGDVDWDALSADTTFLDPKSLV